MPIEFINRQEKGSPLTMLEMDAILDLIKDYANALEALMSISLNLDGTLKNPGFFSGASTNGTDSYTATVLGVTAQAGLIGKLLILKCDVANTGPSTLNVNGYGAFPVVRFQDQPLESGYIKANNYIYITWDGTNYMMQSFPGVVPPVNFGQDVSGTANALVVAVGGSTFIPATLYPGYSIYIKPAFTNIAPGPSAVTLGSLPSVPFKRASGVDLYPGDIVVNRVFEAVYDGANLIIQSTAAPKKMPPWTDTFTLDTYANSVVSHAHDLGDKPDLFRVVLLCNSADAGYSAGAEVNIESIAQNDGDSAFAVLADAVSIYVVIVKEGTYRVPKGDGSMISPTFDPTKWNIKIYATRL